MNNLNAAIRRLPTLQFQPTDDYGASPVTEPELKRCSSGDACIHPDGPDLPATAEYFHFRKDSGKFRNKCIKCCNENTRKNAKRRMEQNPERERENNRRSQKNRRLNHHESVLEATRQWNKRNPQKISERNSNYRLQHPEKNAESLTKRKQRLDRLENNFSQSDWIFALNYFNNHCAACGRSPDNGLILSPDHWIAVSDPRLDNPGTVPANIVPLCYGVDGCQGSKHALDPEVWLIRRFGESEGKLILDRIRAYFDHLKNR